MMPFKIKTKVKCVLIVGLLTLASVLGTFSNGVAAERYYFLSEVGGCDRLVSILESATSGKFAHSTLVIDRVCELSTPLVIPKRLTLAGVGVNGEGTLKFSNLPGGASAISLEPLVGPNDTTHITIRDLTIEGESIFQGNGINVSNSNFVTLQNIRVSSFLYGVIGFHAGSLHIDHSNISANGRANVYMGSDTANWRIRDNVLNHGNTSVQITAPSATGHVIDSNTFVGNARGIWANGHGTMIAHNRFMDNTFRDASDIYVYSQAQDTRILGNYFNNASVLDIGTATECAHNIGLGAC